MLQSEFVLPLHNSLCSDGHSRQADEGLGLPRSLLEVLVQDEVTLDELHLRLRVCRAVLLPKVALSIPGVEALDANHDSGDNSAT